MRNMSLFKPGSRIQPLASFAIAFFLLSCASSGAPPIESREPPPSRRINVHEVQQDETLYSIAWRYEADYREMARINGLSEPYDLASGQALKIYDDGSPVPRVTTKPVVDRSSGVTTAPVVRGAVETRTSSNTAVPSARSSSPSAPSSRGSSPIASSAAGLPAEVNEWNWPIKGRVTNAFGSDSRTKGIVIDPGAEIEVSAAADGVVVYAGTGIRGVGNLLIIKHSDLFLSAYAYNSELLANEGDRVHIGQSIARVGKNIDGLPRVYFEIRRDGKPVDPVRYLPPR